MFPTLREATEAKRAPCPSRVHSFRCALRGCWILVSREPNTWIHAGASLCVIAVGNYVGITRSDWCWLILAMGLVWVAEGLNTAIELLADAAIPEWHTVVGQAKDVAAGAVLLSAITAAAIGACVLGPPLWELWSP